MDRREEDIPNCPSGLGNLGEQFRLSRPEKRHETINPRSAVPFDSHGCLVWAGTIGEAGSDTMREGGRE